MTGRVRAIPEISGYRHVRLISDAGGYGDVHLYDEVDLGRKVAVKVIRDVDLSPMAIQRFVAEGNAMATLEHPNIVRIYRAGRTLDGRPFLAMQFCNQATMEDQAAGKGMRIADVLNIGIAIGGALESAHRARLLHRDVKPANILTQPSGLPALTDFGVAASMTGQTHDDDVGVSIPWSPPEMLFSTTPGSPASDVYSLAATLWHLLVGHSPFEVAGGDNRRAALMERIRDHPVPLTGRPDVPDSLERLLRHALAKRPEQRPASMLYLVRGLQAVQADLGLSRTEPVIISPQASGSSASVVQDLVAPAGSDPHTEWRPRQAGSVAPGGDGQNRATALRPQSVGPAPARSAAPDQTELRPRASEVNVGRAPDPQPKGGVKGLLVAAVIGVLVMAVGLGVLLASRGRDAPAVGREPRASVAATGPAEDSIPPGVPSIKGARSGETITFSWTYSAALANDTFQWEVVGSAQGPQTASKPTVTVQSAPGKQVCVHVKVVRFDGSNPQREWSPELCVA